MPSLQRHKLIKLSSVSFRYLEGDFSLQIPALAVGPTEKVAVVGPSGSGKSTLLHIIAGIRIPQSGQVVTDGVDVTALDDAARREFRIRSVGLVFQEFELLEYLTVLDNILLPYRIGPILRLGRDVRERAAELAGSVGIGDKLRRYPDRLSHGERQRVAVCRALLTEPDLLLADEPTGNLDPANKGRVLEILLDYAEAHGATLVTVTHDHDLLPSFARVIDFKDFYDLSGSSGNGPREGGER